MSDVKRGPKLAKDIESLKNPKPSPTPAPKHKPTQQKRVSKKTVQGHYHNN